LGVQGRQYLKLTKPLYARQRALIHATAEPTAEELKAGAAQSAKDNADDDLWAAIQDLVEKHKRECIHVSVSGGGSRSTSDTGRVNTSSAYIECSVRQRGSWKGPLCVGRYAECERCHEHCEVQCRCETYDA